MPRVKLESVTKSFGRVKAVDNVSVEFKDGEFGVLLGPSGCGKTTTLRLIAGLETPDQGEIYVGDRCVTDLPPQKRDVAMVFQNYVLYPHMTVFDNMAYPLKARKASKEEIKRKVKAAAETLKIGHLFDRKPAQLSGGQAQRAAIGRAIVREPKVFLMDEPLANLDARLRLHMRGEIKRLQMELGITTIYVTHDQAEAMAMADKILVMDNGKAQQDASPTELFTHPANVFIARFIGEMPANIIDGILTEKNGSKFIDLGFFSLPVPEAVEKILAERATKSEVKVGIRPKGISLYNQEKPYSFKALVYVIESLGDENIVTLKAGNTMLKARIPLSRLKVGDHVWVKFNMDKLHFFDGATEKNLIL